LPLENQPETKKVNRKLILLAAIASAAIAAPAFVSAQSAAPAAPAPAVAPAAPVMAGDASLNGKLAWYGRKFAGRRTASGERFDPEAMTMAHKTLPFGTLVKVTNPRNGKSVTLRVNDRGPTQPDRVGDVSLAAARALGMVRAGVIDAELQVVGEAPSKQKR
jgi:rare lipoprotein A